MLTYILTRVTRMLTWIRISKLVPPLFAVCLLFYSLHATYVTMTSSHKHDVIRNTHLEQEHVHNHVTDISTVPKLTPKDPTEKSPVRTEMTEKDPYYIENKYVNEDKFSVVILSYERVQILKDTVAHYARMRNSSVVYVVWSNQKMAPPTIEPHSHWFAKVVVKQLPANNLTLRFKPREEVVTSAVFTTGDDMRIHEVDMDRAFLAWKSNPRKAVGFFARKHVADKKRKGAWVYALVDHPNKQSYSMILTGACFYHRNIMHTYFTAQPPKVLSLIDEWKNCEDIAMNFLLCHLYPGPCALYVHPLRRVMHTSFDKHHHPQGLSARKSHHGQRARCVTEFSKIYNKMPLVMTKDVISQPLKDIPIGIR